MNKKQKIICLSGIKYLIINLTEPLREDTIVYPGDPKPKKILFSDGKKSGFHHYIWQIGDHCFRPHGDAPNHQNIDLMNKGFETFDMDFLFNSAFLIDLSKLRSPKISKSAKHLIEIKKEHIVPYISLFSKKNAVLIRTGYDKWLEANKPYNIKEIPFFSDNAAEFISKFKNIKVIGIDSPTVDKYGSHFAHQMFKDKLIVESIVNLHGINKRFHKKFDLQTATCVITGATGGPVNAFAFIKI